MGEFGMTLVSCLVYLAFTGAVSFVLGRLLPKRWFSADRCPFITYAWEQGGRIYEKLNIKSWQKKLPDMSRLFGWLMPRKQLDSHNLKQLPRMIQETCVAEFIHVILCFSGLWCVRIWQGLGGVVMAGLNVVGNLAFVVIQRYNRPRLIHLGKALCRRNRGKEAAYACTDSKL